MDEPRLVLDANILVRAVLGRRVKAILATYAPTAQFAAPEAAYADADEHLPAILAKHGRADEIEAGIAYLAALRGTVVSVPESIYTEQRRIALARIGDRDPDDWTVLASALVLRCAIWTEDRDFFGTGVPTWTTNHVELYLGGQ